MLGSLLLRNSSRRLGNSIERVVYIRFVLPEVKFWAEKKQRTTNVNKNNCDLASTPLEKSNIKIFKN